MSFNRFSYTMVRTFLDCPKSFEFRYLRKSPVTTNGRMLAGRVYHHGVEYALKRKMRGEVIKVEEVHDLMCDRWLAEVGEHTDYDVSEPEEKLEAQKVDWAEDNPGALKDVVLKLAGVYIAKVMPGLKLVLVEQKLAAMVGGVPFQGYPDVVVEGPGVIDHKFATRRANQEFIDKDLQFSAYAALLGKPAWGAWHQALDQKKPDINVVMTERSQDDIEWFGRVVAGVSRGIDSGIFPPNPLSWKHTEERCPYWLECRVLMEV